MRLERAARIRLQHRQGWPDSSLARNQDPHPDRRPKSTGGIEMFRLNFLKTRQQHGGWNKNRQPKKGSDLYLLQMQSCC